MQPEIFQQWAVEVPGRGYVGWGENLEQNPQGIDSLVSAEKVMDGVKNRYVNLGCPEIADTCRVVHRTATITYSEWSELPTSVGTNNRKAPQ